MGQYNSREGVSGIKVLDRAVIILNAIALQPRSLAELCEETELPRATAHRLATALEAHGLLARATDGRWQIGPTLVKLGSSSPDALVDAAAPIMHSLMERIGESVQLYRLTGMFRTCIASIEPASGLQNTVPVGSRMPLTAGSAARVFMAFAQPPLLDEKVRDALLAESAFTLKDLEEVRKNGWAESIAEREAGLASVSAPVFDANGDLIAALSISGPAARFGENPGERWANDLLEAAAQFHP